MRTLARGRALARWADGPGLESAIALAERHRMLGPRRLTASQLAGFHAVAGAAADASRLVGYTENQAARAARAGRTDVTAFWKAAGEAVDRVAREARDLAPEDTMRMVRAFVQHLVAHFRYLGGEGQRR